MRSFSKLQFVLVGAEPSRATGQWYTVWLGATWFQVSLKKVLSTTSGVHSGTFWLEPPRLFPGTTSQAVMEKGFPQVILAQIRLETARRSKILLCC